MDETVDRGDRHGGIGEDVVPLAKGRLAVTSRLLRS